MLTNMILVRSSKNNVYKYHYFSVLYTNITTFLYTSVCRVAPGLRAWRWLGSLALCSLCAPLGVSPRTEPGSKNR